MAWTGTTLPFLQVTDLWKVDFPRYTSTHF